MLLTFIISNAILHYIIILTVIIIIIIWYEWDGYTALMIAAIYGHIEIVLALIKANANVNDKDKVHI